MSSFPADHDASAPRCLVLTGPTAAGKSTAAMAIAASCGPACPVEIVSVDSAQVYRGLDIGTAKPTAAERAAVRHHLLDIVDPTDAYSAARFAADAGRLIDEIAARGAVPLLVGGTFLYFKALFDGLHALPPSSPETRAALQAALAERGILALHARLAQVDPVTAQRLAPTDTQRILRALEVHAASGGVPLADFHARPRAPGRWPPVISLEPQDRGWLRERIDRRFDAMLADGLVEEVSRLRSRGDLRADLPSMRCVGYRQAWDALDRGDAAGLPARGATATRQLAKRQLTWLRSRPDRRVVAADAPDAVTDVVALARALVHAR